MNAKFSSALKTLILLSALATAARATAPELMNYQGRIKESGLPVTGTRSVDIQICDALTGGTCVDTGAQDVPVVNGLFRATFTAPSPIAWETGERYLEISVDGTAFTPRERLAAAPYAIYASSAATLIPNPGDSSVFIAASLVLTDTNFSVGGTVLAVTGTGVGVGTSSPGTALEVKGTATFSGVSHLHATGAGATTPGVGGCGLSSVLGSDGVGRITMAVAGGSCSLAFGTPWSGNPPVCFFQDETTQTPIYSSPDAGLPTSIVNFSGSFLVGDVISYICLSY